MQRALRLLRLGAARRASVDVAQVTDTTTIGRAAVALVAAALALALAPGAARAQEWERGPEHRGFFARLTPGVAYLNMRLEDDDLQIAGAGLHAGLALGGALSPNVVLYGQAMGSVARDPAVRFGRIETRYDDTSAELRSLGIGVAYYFMPSNVYLSGGLLLSEMIFVDSAGREGRSERGGGLTVSVGKEWWVSRDWALGVAGTLVGASMKNDDVSDRRWRSSSLSIELSATYN